MASDARTMEIERKLSDLLEEVARCSERQRAFLAVYIVDRKETTNLGPLLAQQNQLLQNVLTEVQRTAPVKPPERPGITAATAATIAQGGWPSVLICTSPFLFAAFCLLLWTATNTGTPLPELVLAFFGVHHAAAP